MKLVYTPRYMVERPMAGGRLAFYWTPRKLDVSNGFPLKAQSLGYDRSEAERRCDGDPKPRPYSFFYARNLVRRARRTAKLPEHITLAACRHGGMTEFGDAEITEQGVMSLSGHRSPKAARLYIKRTETQRATAARRRRAWVEAEQKQAESRKTAKIVESK